MQLVLDDNSMNQALVARFMDVATYDQGSDMTRLESHMLNGILSRREMISKWIEVTIPDFMQDRLYTPEHEISVFAMSEFKYQTNWAFLWTREIALLLPRSITTESSIIDKEIDHPVISDSVPSRDREILWIYLKDTGSQAYKTVQSLCDKILWRNVPIVYKKWGFWKFEIASEWKN